MQPNTLNFIEAQFALSLKNILIDPEKHFSTINEAMGGVLTDVEINAVPYIKNDEQLVQIPVVVSKSSNNEIQLNLSRGRIDLFIKNEVSTTDESELIEKFEGLIDSLVSSVEVTNVKWIAALYNYMVPAEDLNAFNKNVLNNDLLALNSGDTHSFNFVNTNKILVGEIESNNYLQIASANVTLGGVKSEGVLIKQDFNTRPSDNEFSSDSIRTYVTNAKDLIKKDRLAELLIK